jgi:MFS family permease
MPDRLTRSADLIAPREEQSLNVFANLAPDTRRNLLRLFVSSLLFWSSLTCLLPTLSLYIDYVGATRQQVGIVIGAFAIGLLAFRPWLGRMADLRSRRLVLLIGLVVVTIAPLGYLFTTSIPLLIVVRAFHGVSIAAFTTASSALVVDLSPPQQRGELIGYTSLAHPIGMALGPAIGGFMQAGVGYTPMFLTAAGLGLLGLLLALGIKSDRRSVEASSQPMTEQPFWQLVWSPRFRIPTIVLLLVGLAFGTLITFIPLFLKEAANDLNPGLFYTAAAIASFVVRLLTGRASDRYGRGRFITFSLVLYLLAMLLLWIAPSATAFLLAAVLEGGGGGILIPMMLTLIADRSDASERGRVFGLCMSGFDLGMALAGPAMGFFAEQLGYRSLFGLASGLVLLGLLSFVSQNSKDLSHSLQFSLGQGRDLYAQAAAEPIKASI